MVADGRILVGTCSWTDKTLTDETDWYPKKSMTAAERLAYYSARYPIVEADSTYYFPPSRQLTKSWVERTPKGFTMNVKAYSLLTGHPTRPASLWRDLREVLPADVAAKRNLYAHHLEPDALEEVWDRFRDALRPLADAGKLGAVLMQYPTWFVPKRDNRDELAAMRERLGDLPVCVEFRAPSWLAPAIVIARSISSATCSWPWSCSTRPRPRSSRPSCRRRPTTSRWSGSMGEPTTHGTRATGSAAERFRYLYSKRQLRAWVPKLEELAGQAREVHALMNNCYQDYGVRNAAELQAMLAE